MIQIECAKCHRLKALRDIVTVNELDLCRSCIRMARLDTGAYDDLAALFRALGVHRPPPAPQQKA